MNSALASLRGAVCGLILVINTVFWATPLYVLVLVKLLLPKGPARDRVSRGVAWCAQRWGHVDVLLADLLLPIHWDIRIHAELNPRGQYLVCANHQSWNDIMVLIKAFDGRAPFFKFFLKQQLIWVPVLGLAWWGLDYPFMLRHTKEQVARNPALKGQDIARTRRACEAFRNQPAMILNFLEGTRFKTEKHARQKSPYRHLLKPKSGGFAFALSTLGQQLDCLLDVTIVYPQGAREFWDFLCGRVNSVIVEVRQLQVPHDFYQGSYETDPEFRARFHSWIGRLWSEKDQRISELLAEHQARAKG
ncbi:1-acyl-sn-glycerol-3-phosphate acyltransferase [Solimonas aquatica]|uniref:1-acyl-sn-glycerol-3-phosphate acyltransferase n=1 Tax=Solimonas aquatica TaxID=489703 RepID=A0A1H9LG83_9GAMM|nr:acyltransferase [Solimonas aquatica]SER10394.1 1-acyl-sn-glycerol-3-phosphate acyltransferase [Solimonas aquatica]